MSTPDVKARTAGGPAVQVGSKTGMRSGRRRRGKKAGAPAKDTRVAETSWLKVGQGLLGSLTSAFAPNVARRQTDIMEKTGGVSLSAADLRAMVNDLAERVASGLEQTADRI